MLIHIGWARSASTAFRENYLRRHPGIRLVSSAVLEPLKRREEFEAREQDPPHEPGKVLCLSDEELSIGLPHSPVRPTDIATRCARVYPGARILAVVRNQVEAIRSFHQLAMRVVPGTAKLADWVEQYFLAPPEGEGYAYLFAYMQTLRAWLRVYPRRNLLVLPYALLDTQPQECYRAVSRWLQIDPALDLPVERLNASQGKGRYARGQTAAIRRLFESDNRALAAEFGVSL